MRDDQYVTTRRQLRGVAESFIAGPQYRAAGTVKLAVRPDGFSGVSIPVAVHGIQLVWGEDGAPLTGTVAALATAAALDVGPPVGAYELVDPLSADTILEVDEAAADLVHRSLYAGGFGLTSVLPDAHPVLWPEHFDVAATVDEVNYRGLARRRLPPLAVRLRRSVDLPHRGVLERTVRCLRVA